MADQKITELTENTTPILTDLIPMVDDPGGTPATQKITLKNLGIIDGWMPASESWAYASASTITVPSGAASKYAVGDRIKWTQTTVKYGVIKAVADTVLTIATNSDYVVTDAAITLNYYSHEANPIGYPHWFNFVPTQAGFSSDIASISCKYNVSNGKCHFYFRSNGDGTSNATNFTLSLPFANAAADPGYQHAWAYTRDNGSVTAGGLCYVTNGSSTLIIGKTPNAEAFTASGGKGANLQITYSIV